MQSVHILFQFIANSGLKFLHINPNFYTENDIHRKFSLPIFKPKKSALKPCLRVKTYKRIKLILLLKNQEVPP